MSYPSTTIGYFSKVVMCLKIPRNHIKTKLEGHMQNVFVFLEAHMQNEKEN
jgi:hypothetical protein